MSKTKNNILNIYFYNLLEQFIKTNNISLYNLDKDLEYHKFVPVTINCRYLYLNKYFLLNIILNNIVQDIVNLKNK